MEPFKALSLLAATAVVSLVGAGAAGFYVGYTSGRGDLEEIKAHLSGALPVVSLPAGSGGNGAVSLNLTPVLEEIRAVAANVETVRKQSEAAPQISVPDYTDDLKNLRAEVKALGNKAEAREPKSLTTLVQEVRALTAALEAKEKEPQTQKALVTEIRNVAAACQAAEPKAPRAILDEIKALTAAVSASQAAAAQAAATQQPVIDELRYLGDQIQALTQAGSAPAATSAPASTERVKSEPGAANEIAQLRQLIAAAADQFGKCQTQLATFSTAALQPAAAVATAASPRAGEATSVVLYDNIILKRDEEKLYNDIGVRLSLQGIAARQVKLAVNKQGFGLAFGERKVFRHQDVECELNLMETNLNDGEARVSIACKR